MDLNILLCLFFMAIGPPFSDGRVYLYNDDSYGSHKRLGKLLRRYSAYDMPTVRKPLTPEELPEAEPLHPGHSLLRPAANSLKSAFKFPHSSGPGNLVYGNYDNLGITYGKSSDRVKYTDFRKNNMMLDKILDSVYIDNMRKKVKNKPPVIILGPFVVSTVRLLHGKGGSKEINDDPYDDQSDELNVRRSSKKKQSPSQYRTRDNIMRSSLFNENANCSKTSAESSTSSESDLDKNPGNPYTVSRSKYKQNWLWNFDILPISLTRTEILPIIFLTLGMIRQMDGNHININPYGPEFDSLGPTGADLFYGRKWWYFNQDDYVPLG